MNTPDMNLDKYLQAIQQASATREIGKVTQVNGLIVRGFVPGATVGSICEIYSLNKAEFFLSEVVGFIDRQILLMPLNEMRGVGLGSKIVLRATKATVAVGTEFLGRVINGLGEPIDGKGSIDAMEERSLYGENTNPLLRPPIREALSLGVRAIDGLNSVGKGQRLGIMAGSGVGKSVLLGMMARSTQAQVNVIALVGERGREVREFIETSLGPEGLAKSVVVVATSDQSPLLRMRAAFVAATLAEQYAAKGLDVLFMMDSATRFAMAQREIGLSVGEPPASKGYTPSVFALLPKLLERAGNFENGSITGLYTVLVEGDDMDDPIGDAVRSIVDGHIVLTRSLAHKGHFPAVDILQSTSRVMRQIVPDDHMRLAMRVRENMAIYKDAEDLLNIGAYKKGANPRIDQAVRVNEEIVRFLKQDINEESSFSATAQMMARLGV